jgi:acyl-CoA synthetase (AMP-forming)/AMP-acid ligase II
MTVAPEAARFALPESLRAAYYDAGYWRDGDLWSSFEAVVTANPDATAFVDGDRSLTFGELCLEAERLGRALRASGLEPGEVAAVHGRHGLASAIAIMGCAHAGVVVALLPHMFSTEQIRAILDLADARVLFALGEAAEVQRSRLAAQGAKGATLVVTDLPGEADSADGHPALEWNEFTARGVSRRPARESQTADDLALLVFSSGTTGDPKGVMHSANTARFSVETYARYQSIGPSDTSLVVTAFGFIGSSVLGTFLTYLCGCRTILQRSWNAEQALSLIETHRVTHLLLMPTHAIDILRSTKLDATNCASLSRGVVAGIDEAHRLDSRRRLCARPYPMYGMSESPAHVTGATTHDIEDLRTTEGRALPGTELRICDDEDRDLPTGSQGNILVRGPNRFLGYFRNDELNRASLTADGFFRTGDVGFVDDTGLLTFVSRSKDIIRRGGVTVTPADVEAALRSHPRIADVAVIGLPDPRLGERACACVITRDGADMDLAAITSFLESTAFPRYLWPESVVTCTSFPRTPSLKVQKPELRRQVLAATRRSKGTVDGP